MKLDWFDFGIDLRFPVYYNSMLKLKEYYKDWMKLGRIDLINLLGWFMKFQFGLINGNQSNFNLMNETSKQIKLN